MTKLQVAIDLLTTEAALELAHSSTYVDIIELGTPLIKSEGLSVVTAMKTAFPDKLILQT
jgi:3-hexulose-6-phosphate synthase